MITWTLTSADHARSGAGTDTHHAIAEALDAILDLYDQHVAGGCPGPLPVCTAQIGDRDVIIVRDIITADPDRGRDDLAAYLTDLLVDLTGDELAALPSAPHATLSTSTEGT